MSVAMLLRDKVFGDRTVVMTSATLELGGTFDAVAGTLGLRGEGAPEWQGLDVGSPFDYPKQAIAYVAKHLPAPGRDGISEQTLDEIEALVRAAGGRTLGLFSSMRAARDATEAMRERLRGRHRLPLPGGGPDRHPGAPVRPRPPDLPVRHAHPLAGRRRARLGLPARHHRPHPVPAPRRPAGLRPLPGHRAHGRQRLHGGLGDPCGPAAGTRRRTAHPPRRRPRSRRLPRLAHDDGPVCRVPPALAAALLADHRPRHGAGRAAAPGRDRTRTGDRPRACPAWRHRSGGRHIDGRRRGGAPASRRSSTRRRRQVLGPRSPPGTPGRQRPTRSCATVSSSGSRWTSSPRAWRSPRTSSRPGCAASASRHPGRPPSASTSGRALAERRRHSTSGRREPARPRSPAESGSGARPARWGTAPRPRCGRACGGTTGSASGRSSCC